jgi:hypothetical protein
LKQQRRAGFDEPHGHGPLRTAAFRFTHQEGPLLLLEHSRHLFLSLFARWNFGFELFHLRIENELPVNERLNNRHDSVQLILSGLPAPVSGGTTGIG